MDEIGLFDPIINALTKKAGKNIPMVVIALLLTTFVAHLDGSGATTFLIVVPAFLPILKRLGFRREALLALICGPYAVMNMGYNLNKLHAKIQNERTGSHLFPLKETA